MKKLSAVQDKLVSKPLVYKKLTLLSPELDGWELLHEWPKLFRLYVRGKESRAHTCSELQDIENRLRRGHTKADDSSAILERAFTLLGACTLTDSMDSEGFKPLKEMIFDDMFKALGPHIYLLLSGKSPGQSDSAATDALALIKRALDGVVRMKYPNRARGTGEAISKEVLAIWHARMRCERFRRLPTKDELRKDLEQIGVSFSDKCKGLKGKWRNLFDRAGLADLPD